MTRSPAKSRTDKIHAVRSGDVELAAQREDPAVHENVAPLWLDPAPKRPLDPQSELLRLQARTTMLERRTQMLVEELRSAVARLAPPNAGEADDFSAVRFDADSLSPFAVGFYQREYGDDGAPFRWTGAGPFCEVRLHFDRRRDRRFFIDVGETDVDILSAMSGYVDYAPIDLTIATAPRGHVLAGVAPMRAATRLAVITLALGPAAEGAGHEWLGFRFYAMDVEAGDGA